MKKSHTTAGDDVTNACDDVETSKRRRLDFNGVRRPVQFARESTYPDFRKIQTLELQGTKGFGCGLSPVFLKRWKSVYSKSKLYSSMPGLKFAYMYPAMKCSLHGGTPHVKTTTPKLAHAMPWRGHYKR
ncbi:hypothetical protein Tco_1370920 [Tanacetum coccineum]